MDKDKVKIGINVIGRKYILATFIAPRQHINDSTIAGATTAPRGYYIC